MAATAASPAAPAGTAARAGRALARLASAAAVLCALAELLAGPAYRIGALALGPALQTMRWGATIAVGAAVVALLALLLALRGKAPRATRWHAGLALALAIAVAAPPLVMYGRLLQLPRIHDISTDTADPPAFDAVLPRRALARNPVDYSAATAAQQRSGYPDLEPLLLPLAPAAAFERALQAARAMGWEIVAASAEALRLEATDTTLLFGFEDDVVVRIRPHPQGSVVDVRSLSRIGGSDFGTNATRVRAYLKRLADRAATP